ncbi:sodium:solute symporter family transporter [Arsenicicoccus dermatophilus]|uniref:sodium:solute symporter family transporter n=1 Tax=Arsenicicoccus dermatophilus TaxID=1076331 RepID=UPI003916FA23
MSLPALDNAVIAAYFLVMIGIGVWSMRMANTREDYLVAGRRLSFPMFFACMAAMAVGGAVTVGGTGKGYKDGIAGMWVGGSLGMGLILLGMLISSKLNRLRALSINEVIERNYGPTARVFGAVLTIIYTVALSVVQVVAMGSILAGVLGIDTRLAMVCAGLVVVFYTFLGGMWSVTMTDIVQFVIKTLGIMLIAPFFVLSDSRVGGLGGLIDKVPASHWDLGSYGFTGTLYWILLYVPGLVIGQDIWQRVFTARNERIARTGTLAAGIYSILYSFAAVLLGMAVLAAGIKVSKPGLVFETGVVSFLPTGIAGLLLAAAMAAAMSVASGTILAASTVVYNDLFLRFVRGQKHAEVEEATVDAQGRTHAAHDVWINRAIALGIGVVIIALAVVIEDIFKALDLSYGFLSGCVFIPVFAAFVLKRVSPRAGLVSLALSFLAVSATMIYGATSGDPDFSIGGNYPIMMGMAVGLVSYVVVHHLDHDKIVPNVDPDLADVEELPA